MKITMALIDKLQALKRGEEVPSSALKGEWIENLLQEGVLISRSRGSKRNLFASNPSQLEFSLSHVDERLSDFDKLKQIFEGENKSRASQAVETGNSKLCMVRSCPGFLVNSYEPIICKLKGQDVSICPSDGSMVFISDWRHFTIPENVIVVGIENMENFRQIRLQRKFFESEISESCPMLFVSRYPQSTDLRTWLSAIPNRYVHFGDFDIAGIHIFHSEFYQFLGERASFLIPSDIEHRLAHGSKERYISQYLRFEKFSVSDPQLQNLIDKIHKYKKCYDQEGYIDSFNTPVGKEESGKCPVDASR